MGTRIGDFAKVLEAMCEGTEYEPDDKFELISEDEVKEKESLFGNFFFEIGTRELVHLANGGVLAKPDEYSIFVKFSEEVRGGILGAIGIGEEQEDG